MRNQIVQGAASSMILLSLQLAAATERYVSLDGGHVPPFISWQDAATNIQEAIDAASVGDVIWVTNGVYAIGGKALTGNLTNRVALGKAVTVQSVNGLEVTVIQGAWHPGTTNGAAAVRCAWLTNGAALRGFTLRGGATDAAGDASTLRSGGGVWCVSTNAFAFDCRITGNAADQFGGGAFQGTFDQCEISVNTAGSGGGVYQGIVNRCEISGNTARNTGGGGVFWRIDNSIIRGNSAAQQGGGVYSPGGPVSINNSWITGNTAEFGGGVRGSSGLTLTNCTITRNSATGRGAGGLYGGVLRNCIVQNNTGSGTPNSSGSMFQFSCATPLPPGPGNISADPQFLSDGLHLAAISPCRGAGTNLTNGVDIDGQPWANPPSMGCDEWHAEPVVASELKLQRTANPGEFVMTVLAAGEEPFTSFWTKDGSSLEDSGRYGGIGTTSLLIRGFGPEDAGSYQVIVSNAYGTATSQIAQITVHCVDATGTNPLPPFTRWAAAATNIQDAVDAASAGAVVLVTNGIYSTGGKVMSGGLTNRVALDKALTVFGVNGAAATMIQGAWNPDTVTGGQAARCAWVGDGAVLSGFTLKGGATHSIGDSFTDRSGGGVWCAAANSTVSDCRITGNVADNFGGGTYQGTLNRCEIFGNTARYGGGVASATINNCTVHDNSATLDGGGFYIPLGAQTAELNGSWIGKNSARQGGGAFGPATIQNCTITSNKATDSGGGIMFAALAKNCIVWNNSALFGGANYAGGKIESSCATPLPPGQGNISVDPGLLADNVHLAETSPCRGAGTNLVVGTDIDGQSWADPPSMGCDEWSAAPAIGWLAISAYAPGTLTAGAPAIAGLEPFWFSWLHDGEPVIEDEIRTGANSSNLLIRANEPLAAGEYRLVVSNAFGVATSEVARLVLCFVDASSSSPALPYSNWTSAAKVIQDAIDAAAAGEFVVVTNGIYANGGKGMSETLTNRVALDKALTVMSVNGPDATVIEGAVDPVTTNGPLAVRCAWVGDGAVLSGFTLRGGATESSGDAFKMKSGGGVWMNSTAALVANCNIVSNWAAYRGGGVYSGRVRGSLLRQNTAGYGGGAADANIIHSTVAENWCIYDGGGVYGGKITNSILLVNWKIIQPGWNYGDRNNYDIGQQPFPLKLRHCCTSPLCCTSPYAFSTIDAGGNIDVDPQFLDGFHLAVTSPCRGTGDPLGTEGVDFEGEPWADPPTIGFDEVWEDALVGPIMVTAKVDREEPTQHGQALLLGSVLGRVSRVTWAFGDGSSLTNVSALLTPHTWTNPGDFLVTFTAYNIDHPAGVSTNLLVHVAALESPVILPASASGTQFTVSFFGQSGINYIIEATASLVSPVVWETVETRWGNGELIQVVIDRGTDTTKFFRIRTQ